MPRVAPVTMATRPLKSSMGGSLSHLAPVHRRRGGPQRLRELSAGPVRRRCWTDRPEGVHRVDSNSLWVRGNLAGAPTQKTVANGSRKTRLRIASSTRRFDRALNEWVDGDTLYITVTCWRQLADNVFRSLRKGDSVLVQGRLRYFEYDDADSKRTSRYEVDAHHVAADLTRYPVTFARPPRELVATPEIPADGSLGDPVAAGAPGTDGVPAQTGPLVNPWTEPTQPPRETAA